MTAAVLERVDFVLNKHPGGVYLSDDLATRQVPVTPMLTKARELSGAEDRHNGRKEARKRGGSFCLTKYFVFGPPRRRHGNNTAPMRRQTLPRVPATRRGVILTGGEGGWSRISAPASL